MRKVHTHTHTHTTEDPASHTGDCLQDPPFLREPTNSILCTTLRLLCKQIFQPSQATKLVLVDGKGGGRR
jgi:hypothetical protein